MVKIAHIAIWTIDLEAVKAFYVRYFNGVSNEKYINPTKKFESYFISFESGPSLELMRRESLADGFLDINERLGITHIAFTLGSKEAVISLTETLRGDGFRIVGEPRRSGDGYFESAVLDVEGNRIELLA
jgi:catechol 2,3-dioxygenase-like lactoylglutathione lyase family enzyme